MDSYGLLEVEVDIVIRTITSVRHWIPLMTLQGCIYQTLLLNTRKTQIVSTIYTIVQQATAKCTPQKDCFTLLSTLPKKVCYPLLKSNPDAFIS